MSQINDIIEQQLDILSRLKVIITEEKSALSDQNADLLLTLAGNKAKLLDSLNRNDEVLSNHNDKSLLTMDAQLSVKVQQAKSLLAECQQLNSENTSLIELNIASMNRLSQALQASRNASSMTYNGKGKTSTISTLGNDIKA
ncbi:flagellar protein FlgN [Shewanella eurypsychrophilus]|uniref:Flagellar protein FlgN n=1 Tax=Shewanella eurypsychrophilus TaxID=2593656 RepID=A0ABX6VE32_9GAMM|nr:MULTISPECIES: flagellar protein FlgN [Shewanella]QFU23520.1 flagellar protein FlgN [Shewanella sp. YLB-09]QPG58746.1 flagellar protein FlgN [Shewanella eurypsychrophilus]